MSEDRDKRRLIAIPISPSMIISPLRKGSQLKFNKLVNEDGIPEDAQYVMTTFDATSGTTLFIFHHESFMTVPPNQPIPQFVPTIKFLYETEDVYADDETDDETNKTSGRADHGVNP